MSKLKFLNLFLQPLYLKIRGRIVGSFSKITLAIYIGFGLFTVVSITLVFIFANLPKDSGAVVSPDKNSEQQLIKAIPEQPVAVAAAPKKVPEVAIKEKKEVQEQQKHVNVPPKPIKGQIQLDFGWQNHPVYKDWRYHTGIDIKGNAGQEVRAIYKGQVMEIFRDGHSGLTVVVKDDRYQIYYGSLSETMVQQGSIVNSNQVIGKMGSCTGEPDVHLHLGIKKDQQYVDPKLIIPIDR